MTTTPDDSRKDSPTMSTPEDRLQMTEAVAEQVQRAHAQATDLAARLSRGERLTVENLYDGLHARILHSWWSMIARHGDEDGLDITRVTAKFTFWIGCYLTEDLPVTSARGDATWDKQIALAHLERAQAYIKRAAAREFLAFSAEQSKKPAGTEEAK